MSDDLVKRLRDPAFGTETTERNLMDKSADRIKELEAKLAKAVEALYFYADGEWPQDYPGGVLYASGDDTPEFKTHLDYGDKARATLAELKGETDE